MALTKVSYSMISGEVANILDYGAIPNSSSADNHDAILAAVAAVYANGGGTVFIPQGVWYTSPISMEGYSDIVIAGQGMHYDLDTSKTATTIIFKTAGTIGLQFCDTTNPDPEWNAPHCRVENLTLDGNDLVTTCINGNYNLTMRDMSVTNATGDGIVWEDFTYPALMQNVYSHRHGGHGCFVKGPQTTKYTFEDCRFDYNQGYGLYMQSGGGGVHIKDCVIQSNYRGGVKIRWVGQNYPGSPYYCDNFLFTNLYTEDNGKLENTDPNYEGNFAFVCQAYNTTSGPTGKPTNLRFVGGSLNPSNAGLYDGKTYSVNSVFGLDWGNVSVDHTLGVMEYPAGCNLITISTYPNEAGVPTGGEYPIAFSYGIPDPNLETAYTYYEGGISGSRGRPRVFEYQLPSITAGTTVQMLTPALQAGGVGLKGYPMLQDGSVLAMQMITAGPTGAGTLTARWRYSFSDNGVDPNTSDNTLPLLVLNKSTENYTSEQFKPMEYNIPGSYLVGFQIEASGDYSPGASGLIQLYVTIES